MIQIAIVESSFVMRNGYKQLFSQSDFNGIDLLWIVSTGQELLKLFKDEKENFPTIVLIDFQTEITNGIELIQILKDKYSHIKTILHTYIYSPDIIINAISAGASCCLSHEIEIEELYNAIKEVHQHGYYIKDDYPDEVILSLMKKRKIKPSYDYLAVLTKREKQIAILIGQSYTYPEIAKQLGLSKRTVEEHKNNFSKKTGVGKISAISVYCLHRWKVNNIKAKQ